MSAEQGASGVTGGLKGMRRKAVQTTELAQLGFLPGNEEHLPLVITPAVDNVDLAAWCASHAEEVEGHLDRHGAILFRGFPLAERPGVRGRRVHHRRRAVRRVRRPAAEPTGEKIYESTPYPADKMILFHNESSHSAQLADAQFSSA